MIPPPQQQQQKQNKLASSSRNSRKNSPSLPNRNRKASLASLWAGAVNFDAVVKLLDVDVASPLAWKDSSACIPEERPSLRIVLLIIREFSLSYFFLFFFFFVSLLFSRVSMEPVSSRQRVHAATHGRRSPNPSLTYKQTNKIKQFRTSNTKNKK